MGRKATTLTQKQIDEVETLAAILSKEQIADYFCVSRPTFDAIIKRQPEIGLQYKKGKAKAIGSVAQGLLQQARSGNITAQMFYLKTQAGWREKADVVITETTPDKSYTINLIPAVKPADEH